MLKFVGREQLLHIIKTHLTTAAVAFLMGMFLFLRVVSSELGSVIYSLVFTAIYFMSMYSAAYDCCMRDKKSYTEEKPYAAKGLALPLGLTLLTAAIWVLYEITWHFITIDGSLATVTAVINNVIFTMWTFMFSAFMDLNSGSISTAGYIITLLLPFAACGLGYYAGYKGFDLTGIAAKFIYEKKNGGRGTK